MSKSITQLQEDDLTSLHNPTKYMIEVKIRMYSKKNMQGFNSISPFDHKQTPKTLLEHTYKLVPTVNGRKKV